MCPRQPPKAGSASCRERIAHLEVTVLVALTRPGVRGGVAAFWGEGAARTAAFLFSNVSAAVCCGMTGRSAICLRFIAFLLLIFCFLAWRFPCVGRLGSVTPFKQESAKALLEMPLRAAAASRKCRRGSGSQNSQVQGGAGKVRTGEWL